MSWSELGHYTLQPFLHREQCMSLKANQITSAEWAAAVSQSRPLLVTSASQLDSNREFDQLRKKGKEREKKNQMPFLLEIKTLLSNTPKSLCLCSNFTSKIPC